MQPRKVDPAGQWPSAFVGAGDVGVSALAITSRGIVVAGHADEGMRVAGFDVSTLSGAWLVGLSEVAVPQWGVPIAAAGRSMVDAVVPVDGPALVFAGAAEGGVGDAPENRGHGRLDCMVGRKELAGDLTWLRTFGGPGEDLCRRVVATKDALWVVGSYREPFGDLPQPQGMSDVMVLRLDSETGELQSSFAFGSAGDDHGRDVTIAVSGEIVVAGTFGGPFDDEGVRKIEAGVAALELTQELTLVSVGDYDGFVAAFDPDGTPRWATAVSGPGFDVVKRVIPHDDGFLVTGAQQAAAPPKDQPGLASDVPLQGVLLRLEGAGEPGWTWTDPNMASLGDISMVRDRIVAVGHHREGFDIGRGPWKTVGETGASILLFDERGQLVGGFGCDSPGDDLGRALATSADGRIAFGGTTATGGGCVRMRSGHTGGFVRMMVLDQNGKLRPLVVERGSASSPSQ